MGKFQVFDENATNMMSSEEYANNIQRVSGVQAGIASSSLQNRQAHQASYAAVAVARFMESQGYNADDDASIDQFINNYSESLNKYLNTGTNPPKFITDALGLPDGASLFDVLYALSRVPDNEIVAIYKLNYPVGFDPTQDVTTGLVGMALYNFNSDGILIARIVDDFRTVPKTASTTMALKFSIGFSGPESVGSGATKFGQLVVYEATVVADAGSVYEYRSTTTVSFGANVKSVDVLVVGAGGRGGSGASGGGAHGITGSGFYTGGTSTGALPGGGGGGGGGTGQVVSQLGITITPGVEYIIDVGKNGGKSSAFGLVALGGNSGGGGGNPQDESGGGGSNISNPGSIPFSSHPVGQAGSAGAPAVSGGAYGGVGGTGGRGGNGFCMQENNLTANYISAGEGGGGGASSRGVSYVYWGDQTITLYGGGGGGGGQGGGGGGIVLWKDGTYNIPSNDSFIKDGANNGTPISVTNNTYTVTTTNALINAAGGASGSRGGVGGQGGGGGGGAASITNTGSTWKVGYVPETFAYGGAGHASPGSYGYDGSGGGGGGGGSGVGGCFIQASDGLKTWKKGGGVGGQGGGTAGLVRIRVNYK